jgi:hypothetical protein
MVDKEGKQVISSGIGIGVVMACVISFAINKSFWWMFLHGALSWFYLIYYGLGFAGAF